MGFLAAFLAGFLAAFLAAGFLAAFLGFLAFLTTTSLYLPAPFPEALAFLRVPLASPRLRARRTWTAALAASTLLLATTCLRMAWREEPPLSFSPFRAAAIMVL